MFPLLTCSLQNPLLGVGGDSSLDYAKIYNEIARLRLVAGEALYTAYFRNASIRNRKIGRATHLAAWKSVSARALIRYREYRITVPGTHRSRVGVTLLVWYSTLFV